MMISTDDIPAAPADGGHPGGEPSKPVSAKKQSIDIGLDVLLAIRAPGETLSAESIAEVCDCAPQRIQQLEARALKKLRAALQKLGFTGRELDPENIGLPDHVPLRSAAA